MNRYAYVFNDPINATDPSGFISMGDVVGGFVAAGHIGALALGATASGNWGSLGAVGAPTVGSSAITVPGLLQSTPGSTGTVGNVAGTNTQPVTTKFHDPAGENYLLEILKGPPKPTTGTIRPGEPIADLYVRQAMARAWNDSEPWSQGRQEQGGWGHRIPESNEYWVERWVPGNHETIDPGRLPEPGDDAFSFHTHPSSQIHGPEYLDRSASPSDWGMFVQQRATDPNHVHYIVSKDGIYRLQGKEQQWIAKISYLFR